MADKTGIEWADATWNPIVGCSIVSPGCTNCYAMKQAARIEAMQPGGHYAGLTFPRNAGPVWTGRIEHAPDHILTQPLRWKKPRTIFVNSMGDLFHEAVSDAAIARVFAIMTLATQHTFLVLTKRARRMHQWFHHPRLNDLLGAAVIEAGYRGPLEGLDWPLKNVWLGVSTERQAEADERIPLLLAIPAAKRFISAEPLLGPIDLRHLDRKMELGKERAFDGITGFTLTGKPRLADGVFAANHGHYELDWVIAGGESGKDARPMHPDWARGLRDQCADAGVPFFFKQWGEWKERFHDIDGPHVDEVEIGSYEADATYEATTNPGFVTPSGALYRNKKALISAGCKEPARLMERIGKARAGRLLDGVEHSERPQP